MTRYQFRDGCHIVDYILIMVISIFKNRLDRKFGTPSDDSSGQQLLIPKGFSIQIYLDHNFVWIWMPSKKRRWCAQIEYIVMLLSANQHVLYQASIYTSHCIHMPIMIYVLCILGLRVNPFMKVVRNNNSSKSSHIMKLEVSCTQFGCSNQLIQI